MQLGDGVFQVLSTNGDTHLGGDDFDKRIMDWLIQNFKEENGVDLSNDKMALQRLKDAAEKAKKDLSGVSSTHISLPFISAGLLDRLMLNPSRLEQMAEGLRQVAELSDPIGEVLSMKKRPNGLMIGKKRVPLGVVGMIYEARPNVTVDAFALCFKPLLRNLPGASCGE